jgi:micrococcal nuclease
VPHRHVLQSLAAAVLLAVLLPAPAPAAPLEATVLSWHDGDTLRVVLAGRTQTVRLIGIDAPEVSPNDRARDQARRLGVPLRELLDLGRRSRDFASRLAPPGTRVRLELDVQTTDRYGRLLSYLWLPDGSMVNERILEAGWALLLTVPPNVRHADRLREPRGAPGSAEQGCGPPQVRAGSAGPRATRATRTCASPLPRPTWTAGTSPTGGSGCCHLTPTGSTGTGTGSGASGNSHESSHAG